MHDLWRHLGGSVVERWTPKFIPRRFRRHRVCLEAIITPLVMNQPMPCTVLDLSQGGAKLRVSFGALIPARFELAIPSRGERYRCRLVWRTLDALGVEFLARREGATPRLN
jgi:methyl-accepting chemotaxis protein